MNKKLIIVIGPTASGKSELAVKIAKKVGGEIISADSRQIYKGMDIGTGKVEGQWRHSTYVYKSVPHYLIDVASPRVQFSVAKFQKQADKAIQAILKRGKTPIICGGTAHWIDAVVYGQTLPEVKPDAKLRAKLSKLPAEKLFEQLRKLDPDRASEIDANNPRRLIRALEIVLSTGKPVPKQNQTSKYEAVWIGINPTQEVLLKKIAKRLKQRIKQGMLKEIEKLRKDGVSWQRLESFGLEYKYGALLLQNKISKREFEDLLLTAIKQYAKRQMTWWKRNKYINWLKSPTVIPHQLLK